ncbi:hypothetical protein K461DRAFT_67813 [Myriangium duriaei CBS 260.36]|uniref:Uncharacterized protein n=1 Tax=Myriangium duriaei CBS 260.36 TaxID=1168546 RepID=A0A9P4MHN0_9PEZI|nr:hypothetical protein K461DRAFT_67813 [Myriangium duriaei CBS 260.36]
MPWVALQPIQPVQPMQPVPYHYPIFRRHYAARAYPERCTHCPQTPGWVFKRCQHCLGDSRRIVKCPVCCKHKLHGHRRHCRTCDSRREIVVRCTACRGVGRTWRVCRHCHQGWRWRRH